MQPGQMPTGICVIGEPRIAAQVPLEHEHMMPAHRDHAGARRSPREFEPVRGQPQGPDGSSEDADGRPAATEGARRAAGAGWATMAGLTPGRALAPLRARRVYLLSAPEAAQALTMRSPRADGPTPSHGMVTLQSGCAT